MDRDQAWREYEDAERAVAKAAAWHRDMSEQMRKAEQSFSEAITRRDAAENQWKQFASV